MGYEMVCSYGRTASDQVFVGPYDMNGLRDGLLYRFYWRWLVFGQVVLGEDTPDTSKF